MPGGKYYWLKLHRDFFKRHDVRIIEKQTNGKDYIIFYLKLLTECIDHDGQLRFSEEIPYDVEMLSMITDTNVDIVRSAVTIFTKMGLMECWDNGTFFMSKINKMIGSESGSRSRVELHREKRKEISNHMPIIEPHMNNVRYGGNYYKVYDRDEGSCVMCGNKDNLCVHHICAYDSNNPDTCKINNMITLCRSCHSTLHNGTKSQADMPHNDILSSIGYVTPVTCNAEVTQEIELEKEKEKDIEEKAKRKRFTPPTIDEVTPYCQEKGVDPQKWHDHYTANGWMVGRNKMKDWEAAVRTWSRNEFGNSTQSTQPEKKPAVKMEYAKCESCGRMGTVYDGLCPRCKGGKNASS